MNILDIFLAIPLIYGLVRGLYKGIVAEISSLVSIVGGIVLSYFFSEDLYQYMIKFMQPSIGVRIASYVIVFFIVVVIIYMIGKSITKVIDFLSIGILNHILGGAFGLAKMVILMIIAVHFVHPIQESQKLIQKEIIEKSRLYTFFMEYSPSIGDYMNRALEIDFKEPGEESSTPIDTLQ